MILKSVGTSGRCQTTAVVPHGSQGLQLSSINVPPNSAEYSPEFVDGISHNGIDVTIPAQASLEDLVQFLNSINHNSNKVIDVYFVYGESLFEMYVLQYAVNISNDFAAYIGTSTANFAANSLYDTVWNLEAKDPVLEYCVEVVGPFEGVFEGGDSTSVVGYVEKSRGPCNDAHLFNFTGSVHTITVGVKYRLKSGPELKPCISPTGWAVTFKLR